MVTVTMTCGGDSVNLQVTARNRDALHEAVQNQERGTFAIEENRQLSASDRTARLKELEARTDARIQALLAPEEYQKYREYKKRVQSMTDEQNRAMNPAAALQTPPPSPPPPARTNAAAASPRPPAAHTDPDALPKIQGIVSQNGKAAVLINGRILTAGNWVGQSQIVSITKSNVVFQKPGEPQVVLNTNSW
jgi:hypothetical protein